MHTFLRGRRLFIAIVVAGVLLAGGAAAAFLMLRTTGRSVTVPGDQVGCVYSSPESGHRLIRSIQSGQHATIGKTDELVQLPTNDIVYNITSKDTTEGAPQHLLAYTKGQVGLFVEGVLKFRFNTAGDRACKWYSRYGMQSNYGDMGFTVVQGPLAQRQSHEGWFRFLAEAQGNTMKQVVHDGSTAWTWQQLTYGAEAGAKTSANAEPVSITYGKQIGALASKYLALDLGGDYFCGVQPDLTGAGQTEGCPPMYFQVISEYPRDKALADAHEAIRRLDAQLGQQKQTARLQAENRSTAIAAAQTQRKVLQEQIINARLTALNDVEVQKCLIYAQAGLDCAGKKPAVIVPGVTK